MPRNGYREIQTRLIWIAFAYPFWMLATPVWGFIALCKFSTWFRRRRLRNRQVASCARGHSVPLYGVYECACGAVHEGRVFGECRICHETCGWTPCLECGLPIGNPFV
jgi:hypothetical protein